MMMNDNRECAQAVNAMLVSPGKPGPKLSDRQVEEHPRCFLFGHYDSRGGATLIPARNLIEAFQKYASSFGFSVDEHGQLQDEGMRQHFAQYPGTDGRTYEDWLPDSIHSLMEEDFMFSCRVVVCDAPFEGEADLDEAYAEEGGGYRYGLVQYRWRHKHYSQDPKEREELSKWSNLGGGTQKTLIFWKGKEKPAIDPKALGMDYLEGLEVRVIRKSYGEDACGVCWMIEAV